MKKRKKRSGARISPRKKKSHAAFYVGVRDSVEVRRNLLEGAREAIRFMQRYEKLKAIREEKIQTILQLDAEVKELRSLVNKLRKSFPTAKSRVKLPEHKPQCVVCNATFSSQSTLSKHLKRHQAKEEPVEAHAPRPKQAPKPKKKRSLSDLEKLEGELADIEGRLGDLE